MLERPQRPLQEAVIEVEESEIIELSSDRFILLERYRGWPKVGVLWSVRHRTGESDFPLESGTMEEVRRGREAEEVWEQLRETALQAATEAAQRLPERPETTPRGSILKRLFGRR